MRSDTFARKLLFSFVILVSIIGCGETADIGQSEQTGSISVVATTALIGDVTSEIGGELIDLSVLLPPGSDPHSYEPVPQDLSRLESAQLVLSNGLGFEAALEPFLDSLPSETSVVSVSEGIEVTMPEPGRRVISNGGQTEEAVDEEFQTDPHVWFDPLNVIVWTENIASALSLMDPMNRDVYAENARSFRDDLAALDAWIKEKVSLIPAERRLLVTDHETLTYFAYRYDFEIVGTVIPATSTLAEPSAQGMTALAETIISRGIPAIFVGPEIDSSLAEQLAAETGARVVALNLSSLGNAPNGPDTYLDFMRTNTTVIVDALMSS